MICKIDNLLVNLKLPTRKENNMAIVSTLSELANLPDCYDRGTDIKGRYWNAYPVKMDKHGNPLPVLKQVNAHMVVTGNYEGSDPSNLISITIKAVRYRSHKEGWEFCKTVSVEEAPALINKYLA